MPRLCNPQSQASMQAGLHFSLFRPAMINPTNLCQTISMCLCKACSPQRRHLIAASSEAEDYSRACNMSPEHKMLTVWKSIPNMINKCSSKSCANAMKPYGAALLGHISTTPQEAAVRGVSLGNCQCVTKEQTWRRSVSLIP